VPVLVCSSGLWAPLWWWVCCKLVSARDRRRRRRGRRRRRRTMPMSKAQRRAPRRGRRGIVKARTKSVFKRCLLDITSAHFTFHLQACVVSMRFHCCLLPVACCLDNKTTKVNTTRVGMLTKHATVPCLLFCTLLGSTYPFHRYLLQAVNLAPIPQAQGASRLYYTSSSFFTYSRQSFESFLTPTGL
jgi:hypothetical protein